MAKSWRCFGNNGRGGRVFFVVFMTEVGRCSVLLYEKECFYKDTKQ